MLLSQDFTFKAAHKLQGNTGDPLHGHSFRLRVTLRGKVNEDGKMFPTADFKRVVRDLVVDKLDKSFLNEHFKQPTMENIIMWIWRELSDLPLYEIKLWENPMTCVTYHGE